VILWYVQFICTVTWNPTVFRRKQMQHMRISSLQPDVGQCCIRALNIRSRAYAPYSKFAVGCAIRGADGEVHVGVNVENAAYPLGSCAEGNAIAQMVVQGVKQFDYLAIALEGGGSPCGGCRQRIWEFCHGNKSIMIYMVDSSSGNDARVTMATIGELLPNAFVL